MRALLICVGALLAAAAVSARGGTPQAVTPSCPQQALTSVAANGWAAARAELVPRGPRTLVLCRYGGLDSSLPRTLVRSRRLGRSALLAQLVGWFDALPPYPRGAILCPLDDGSQILALLRYDGGRRVTVSVALSGCQRVSNGDRVAIASGYRDTPGAQRLIARLRGLTAPARGSARVSGLIQLCGGPVLRNGHTRCFSRAGSVTALDRGGNVVAAVAAPHARFSLSLPAGAYTLVAITSGLRAQRSVTLAAGRSVRANLVVPVP